MLETTFNDLSRLCMFGKAYGFLIGVWEPDRNVHGTLCPIHVKRSIVGDEVFDEFRCKIEQNLGIDADNYEFFGDCMYDIRDAKTFQPIYGVVSVVLFICRDDIMVKISSIPGSGFSVDLNFIVDKYGLYLNLAKEVGNISTGTPTQLQSITENTICEMFMRELVAIARNAVTNKHASYPDFIEFEDNKFNNLIDMIEERYGEGSSIFPKGYFRRFIDSTFT